MPDSSRFHRLGVRLGACGAGLAFMMALLAGTAHAQQGDADAALRLRLYVDALTVGSIDKTPADPDGRFSGSSFGSDSATLEAILYGHIGLSISQQYEYRKYTNQAGLDTQENWVNTYYSLTGYLRSAGHDRANGFLGYSAGTVDRYTEKSNGTPVAPFNPARNLPLTRLFAGVEYTFERIGFRVEWVQSEASAKVSGQKANLDQTLQVLSAYIPFN
ncbi:MAG: hypothetical protein ACHQZQ_01655 [SAR324 cluster bacterium]